MSTVLTMMWPYYDQVRTAAASKRSQVIINHIYFVASYLDSLHLRSDFQSALL